MIIISIGYEPCSTLGAAGGPISRVRLRSTGGRRPRKGPSALMSSPVRARNPQHVILAVIVGDAAGNEEPVAQPVEVFHALGVHRLHRGQFHALALRPPRHRAADM